MILFTILAAIAGIIALLLNGASYSNNFSTIVRVARPADLSAEVSIKDSDGFGRDPLPRYLKHARLSIQGTKNAAGDNADENAASSEMAETPVEEEQSFMVSPRTEQTREVRSIERQPSPK